MFKRVSVYITKDIFKNFFILFAGIFTLIFVIDFTENIGETIFENTDIFTILKVVLYEVPIFLEPILVFILLVSALITFYKLSGNNEITIMRVSGLSLFKITKLSMFVSFMLGVFAVLVYSPLATKLNLKSQEIKNNGKGLVTFRNAIFFKEKADNIIIKANGVYIDSLTFNNVSIMYLDTKGVFLKKIDSNQLSLNENKWIAINNFVYTEGKEREFIEKIEIPATLSKKIVRGIIERDYDSADKIHFLKLRRIIGELKNTGFDTTKFEVKFFSKIITPFLYAVMIFISAHFGIVHNRNNKKFLSFVRGIFCGFGIFISNTIITEFANAKKISVLDGSIFLISIYIIIGIMSLLKKDYKI
ncbi:MAG: LptF/LptG family permease [Rickettsiales bacterium]|jgi:lipopolysaccharide export system permease protein|nr:LptF/LptG family permease [Rickettsiales bacterium]